MKLLPQFFCILLFRLGFPTIFPISTKQVTIPSKYIHGVQL
jgi:hypothetical protein